jgi:YD repeat-containing protein
MREEFSTDPGGNCTITRVDMLGRKTSYSDPDMGTWTYTYDENGNLTSRTDAGGKIISFEYDSLNRPAAKYYGEVDPGYLKVAYFYDKEGHGCSKGRLTRLVKYAEPGSSEVFLEESYTCDERGRVTSITKTIDGISRTMEYAYDSIDRLTSETYPDGEVVAYTYNGGGAIESVVGNHTYAASIDYTATGKIDLIQFGNNTSATYTYDEETDRINRILASDSMGDILDLSYKYDAVGNVTEKSCNTTTCSEIYTYDEMNRLKTADSPEEFYGFKTYDYDTLNNIILKDGRTCTYLDLRPHAVTSDGMHTYTYDPNGNMQTRSDGRIITYNQENRVSGISDGGSYFYDDKGRRIKKVENGKTSYYYFKNYEEVVNEIQQ